MKCYFPNISLSQSPISWQSQQFVSSLSSSTDPKPLLTWVSEYCMCTCVRVGGGSEPVCTSRKVRDEHQLSCLSITPHLILLRQDLLQKEPGTGLVASKPQPLSCLCSQQLRGYKCTQPHPALCTGARILTWVHMPAQQASYLLNRLSNPNTEIGIKGSSEGHTWKYCVLIRVISQQKI